MSEPVYHSPPFLTTKQFLGIAMPIAIAGALALLVAMILF